MFIPLLLLVPLFAALVAIALLRPGMKYGYIASAASLASLLLLYFVQNGSITITWFTIGKDAIAITTTIAPLNMALLAIVFFVGMLIHLYSTGYLKTLSEQKRFYIEMLAFEIAMATFAMSGNFILLFIAWEFLSMLSYMLIGFWHTRERAVRAARLAITTVLIGDIALIAAIVIFWNIFGTFDFAAILSLIPHSISVGLLAGSALLLLAIFTKSAQFPFQEWLPEAMEGPTPVSAFLHSSTMVKAGVFAAIILFPIFAAAHLLSVMLWFGVLTAIIATFNAMREKQVKRVIAYSTVQELSLMLVAVASGALIAAIYFFIVQSFYKALLFFSAGGVMHATDEESIDRIRGMSSNKLLYVSTLFGVLSVAGMIPFSGFFASAAIGSSVFSNLVVYALITLVGLGTSFFIFRWFFMISGPDKAGETALRYKALPKAMVYPAVLLAVLTLAGSSIFFLIPGFLSTSPAFITGAPQLSIGLLDILSVTVLFAVGAAVSYSLYKPSRLLKPSQKKGSPLASLAYTHKLFMLFYSGVSRFMYEISEGVGAFDLYLSEAFDWLGHLVVLVSRGIRRMSVGGINPYAFVFAVGFAVLLAWIFLVIV